MDKELPKLPHPARVIEALDWLKDGCPVLGAYLPIITLRSLLEILPSYIPLYRWGTSENKEAYEELSKQKEALAELTRLGEEMSDRNK